MRFFLFVCLCLILEIQLSKTERQKLILEFSADASSTMIALNEAMKALSKAEQTAQIERRRVEKVR